MTYKHVIVNADGDKAFEKRAAFAAGIAESLGTGVTAVYARLPNPAMAASVWPALPESDVMDRLTEAHEAEIAAQIATLKPVFEKAAGSVAADWLELHGERAASMVVAAQAAGLVVLSQPDHDDPMNYLGRESVSEIVMRCGRPVMFHPYIDAKPTFERILIAWDGSRESVRAMNDATPFMNGAHVLFLTADEGGPESATVDRDRLKAYAEAHGATATVDRHGGGGTIRVSDIVMSRAADFGADLVVMGGYSHSRLRELVLGGTTREILEQMPVPVMMSH